LGGWLPLVMEDLEFLGLADECDVWEIGFKLGHEGVACEVGEELGDVEVGAAGEHLPVDFAAADDEDGAFDAGGVEGGEVAHQVHARDGGGAGDDVGLATGQGAAYGVVGFASHEEGSAEGFLFKPAQVFGEVPGDFTVEADGSVARHGD
jgi:hypothetical protein